MRAENSKSGGFLNLLTQPARPWARGESREAELGLAGWELAIWLFVVCAAIGFALALVGKA
jgi:hypothetical protein